MTGRPNMSIWNDLKNAFKSKKYSIIEFPKKYPIIEFPRDNRTKYTIFIHNFENFFRKIKILFNKNHWERPLIIKDSFITPYYKTIGCKLKGHKWSNDEESIKYEFPKDSIHCWNCAKWSTRLTARNDAIDNIIK